MDEEARPAGARATGDEKFREVLGDNHRLVRVCRIWAELQEHPVVEQWHHPDRVPRESLEASGGDEDVVEASRDFVGELRAWVQL